jgi:hypothetical protein
MACRGPYTTAAMTLLLPHANIQARQHHTIDPDQTFSRKTRYAGSQVQRATASVRCTPGVQCVRKRYPVSWMSHGAGHEPVVAPI